MSHTDFDTFFSAATGHKRFEYSAAWQEAMAARLPNRFSSMFLQA